MHDIEPHYKWRGNYMAERDERSPFYGRIYDEFGYSQKVYNYFIHPQWDNFGSSTLYTKILFTDYDEGFAILEMIGEWNDALHNDVMFVKRELVDSLALHGIHKYVIICENVLNFHGDEDDYYEEWYQEVVEEGGWIVFLNALQHVEDEMKDTRLDRYVHFGTPYNQVNWRPHKPKQIVDNLEMLIDGMIMRID